MVHKIVDGVEIELTGAELTEPPIEKSFLLSTDINYLSTLQVHRLLLPLFLPLVRMD